MNTDPEYFTRLGERLYEKVERAQDLASLVDDMMYNLYTRHQPWDNEEEYNEIMDDILEFLGDVQNHEDFGPGKAGTGDK